MCNTANVFNHELLIESFGHLCVVNQGRPAPWYGYDGDDALWLVGSHALIDSGAEPRLDEIRLW